MFKYLQDEPSSLKLSFLSTHCKSELVDEIVCSDICLLSNKPTVSGQVSPSEEFPGVMVLKDKLNVV